MADGADLSDVGAMTTRRSPGTVPATRSAAAWRTHVDCLFGRWLSAFGLHAASGRGCRGRSTPVDIVNDVSGYCARPPGDGPQVAARARGVVLTASQLGTAE